MPTPTLPITTIATTDTFRTWLARTNTIIDLINSGSILISAAANGGAFGVFTLGNTSDTTSSLTIAGGKFFANATGVYLTGTSVFGANLTVNSSASNTVISSTQTYLLSNATRISGANLVVNATATFNGSVTLTSSSPLTVSANALFGANVTISANVSLSSGLNANGGFGSAGQFLTSNGAGVYWSTLTVVDANSSTSGLVNTSAQTLAGAKTFTGAMVLSSTLSVTGAANLLSTLGITGAANLLSTLGVTGATTLTGTLLTNGVATVNANSTVNGSMKFTGTSARLVVPVGSNLWAT